NRASLRRVKEHSHIPPGSGATVDKAKLAVLVHQIGMLAGDERDHLLVTLLPQPGHDTGADADRVNNRVAVMTVNDSLHDACRLHGVIAFVEGEPSNRRPVTP